MTALPRLGFSQQAAELHERAVPGRARPSSRLHVVVCDDHRMLREALAGYLCTRPGVASVSVAGDADEAIRLTRRRADVLILDLLLGDGEAGLDVLEALRNLRIGAPVLGMSGSDDLTVVARSLSLGALGFCHKTEPPHVLYDATLEVAAGRAVIAERYIAPLMHLLHEDHRGREESGAVLARLTEREQEVLRLLSRGLSGAELARRLGVSSSTARTHLRRVMQKLGVNTQLAAAAQGRELYQSVRRPLPSTNETTNHDYRARAVGSGS